jgi:ATP-dependent DNA ligase
VNSRASANGHCSLWSPPERNIPSPTVAPAAPLPQPMLARSGKLPSRGDWAYEVKWDGFRAIVSTDGAPLRVRSRRGWNMTDLVPELASLPIFATRPSPVHGIQQVLAN